MASKTLLPAHIFTERQMLNGSLKRQNPTNEDTKSLYYIKLQRQPPQRFLSDASCDTASKRTQRNTCDWKLVGFYFFSGLMRSYHSNDVIETFTEVVYVKWLSFRCQHHVPRFQRRRFVLKGERSLQVDKTSRVGKVKKSTQSTRLARA